jgi:hypothetical protein
MRRYLFLMGAIVNLYGFTITAPDPDKVEIVNSDVDHFWQAFDDAAKVAVAERTAIYAKEYFEAGSQGFKDFIAFRRLSPQKLAEHVEGNRSYYGKIRSLIGQVVNQAPVMQAAFYRLKRLYPDIKFPKHVYFVVGAQHGAGMNSDNGIILASEMFATPPGTPYAYNVAYAEYVPFAIVHETVHFNQMFQNMEHGTLLENAVSEGTADFIASLVLNEPAARQSTDRWQYGCAHEAELDVRFLSDEDLFTMPPWLNDHKPDTGWPPDMGYWLGYRIDQSLYAQAKDKIAALRTMLEATDFKALLKKSGYPGAAIQPCVPQKAEQLRTSSGAAPVGLR